MNAASTSSPETSMHTGLDERVERLEREHQRMARQNRLLRWSLLVVLPLAGLLALTGAQGPARKVLEGEEWVLKDAQGRVHARLAVDEQDEAHLMFYDEANAIRLKVGLEDRGPRIDLCDEDGRERLNLWVTQDGVTQV